MFLGSLRFLGAGPDPRTMTCEKINQGMAQNSSAAQYRSGAQHKANAAARVKELEPFYQACKQGIDPSTVTPSQAVAVPDAQIYPGELVPGGGISETTPGRGGSFTTPIVYQPGGAPTMSLDWQKIALIVGGGVALVLVLRLLTRKRKGASSAASVGMGGGI